MSSWLRSRRAVLCLVPVLAWLGCAEADDDDTLAAGPNFELSDTARASPDLAADLEGYRAQLAADPWVRVQTPFRRAILQAGCMSKRGWEWLGPEPSPLDRRGRRGLSPRRGFG